MITVPRAPHVVPLTVDGGKRAYGRRPVHDESRRVGDVCLHEMVGGPSVERKVDGKRRWVLATTHEEETISKTCAAT